MSVWDLALSDLLVFVEKADTSIKGLVILDTLVLQEKFVVNQKVVATSQLLRLADVARVTLTSAVYVGQSLTFTQDAQPRVDLESAYSILGLVQAVTLHQAKGVYHALTLIDSAVCVPCTGATNTLALTQTVTVQKSVVVHAGNTLTMANKARVYEPNYYWISDPTLTVMA